MKTGNPLGGGPECRAEGPAPLRLEGQEDCHLRHHLRQPQAAPDFRRQQDRHCGRRRGPREPHDPGGRRRDRRPHDGPGPAVCRSGLRHPALRRVLQPEPPGRLCGQAGEGRGRPGTGAVHAAVL